MPTLAVYVGVSGIDALLRFSAEKYEVLNFPYPYIPTLFSNQTNESSFYLNLLEMFCLQNKTTLEDCDVIYVSGFVSIPNLGLKNTAPISLNDALGNIENHFPVLVNNYSLVTKSVFSSRVGSRFMMDEKEEVDLHANISIYPQINLPDIHARINADKVVSESSRDLDVKWSDKTPILFMGPRFLDLPHERKELDYLLMVDLIDRVGIYDIQVDRYNSLLLSSILGSGGITANMDVSEEYGIEEVGTLVVTKGNTECLIESDIGTGQVVEVKKNEIFSMPLQTGATARVMIKGHLFGTKEKVVKGGSLGLVIDARDREGSLFSDIKRFDKALKLVKESISSF